MRRPSKKQLEARTRDADHRAQALIELLVCANAQGDIERFGAFRPQDAVLPVIVGMVSVIAELAFDWGTLGGSPEEIAEGFRRTALFACQRLPLGELGQKVREAERAP